MSDTGADPLIIDCDGCALRHSAACDDCIVSFLCDGPGDAVAVDADEARALRLLAAGGLVPRLRLVPADPAA